MSYNPSPERSPERYKPRPYSIHPPPLRPTSYISNSPSSSPTRSPERSPNRRPHSHQPHNSASAPFLPYSESTFSPISAFNPKKITEEALRPKKKKPQLSAPYIHLDFHANLADARIIRDDIPCPVNIRTVTIARWVGVVCRVLQALGAGGILVAFVAMRKMDDSTSWICRVPPGVAMLHTVYSIYHLSGSHRMRTPGSSKMYHLFSTTVDMAVIAFYSFIALLTFRQYQMNPNMKWQTEFSDDKETLRKVVFGVFITTCGSGALTIVSLAISIYLIWACRKLQQLPPDMNPFAFDDGTLKQSLISPDEEDDLKNAEKRWSHITVGSTESSTPFLPSETRKVPFIQTRGRTSNFHAPATPSEGRYRDSYTPLEIDLSDSHAMDSNLENSNNTPNSPHPDDWDSRSHRSSVLRDENGNWKPHKPTPRTPGSPSKSKTSKLTITNPDAVEPLRISRPVSSGLSLNTASSNSASQQQPRSQKSYGTAIIGFDRAALMPEGFKRESDGARFRKVSSEAH